MAVSDIFVWAADAESGHLALFLSPTEIWFGKGEQDPYSLDIDKRRCPIPAVVLSNNLKF